MIRTQISLNSQDYVLAQKEARNLGVSLAEFFRRALKQALPHNKEKPWMNFSGMIETGLTNSSQTIDDIIYGQKD